MRFAILRVRPTATTNLEKNQFRVLPFDNTLKQGGLEEDCPITTFSENKRFSSVLQTDK